MFEPEVIRDQMIFRRWVMMKMFLSALATGECHQLQLRTNSWNTVQCATKESLTPMHGHEITLNEHRKMKNLLAHDLTVPVSDSY